MTSKSQPTSANTAVAVATCNQTRNLAVAVADPGGNYPSLYYTQKKVHCIPIGTSLGKNSTAGRPAAVGIAGSAYTSADSKPSVVVVEPAAAIASDTGALLAFAVVLALELRPAFVAAAVDARSPPEQAYYSDLL